MNSQHPKLLNSSTITSSDYMEYRDKSSPTGMHDSPACSGKRYLLCWERNWPCPQASTHRRTDRQKERIALWNNILGYMCPTTKTTGIHCLHLPNLLTTTPN